MAADIPMPIDDRIRQIPADQVRILKEVWAWFLQNKEWPDGVRFRKTHGKSLVVQTVTNQNPDFLVHVRNSPNEDYYRLTVAGIYAVEGWEGTHISDLLGFLGHIKNRFNENPQFDQITAEEVESQLDLGLDRRRILGEMLAIGSPVRFGGATNLNSSGWSVNYAGAKEDIEDLDGADSTKAFLLRKWGASLKGANRRMDNSQPTTITNTIDVFISHSNHDAEIARGLVDLLRAALNISPDKIRCTSVDGYRLPVGASTHEQLRHETKQAKVFVGLITEASIRSAYVLFELGARWGAGQHLAPLLAAGADSNSLLGPLSGLNALSIDNSAQLHQFIGDIGRILGLTANNPSVYERHLDELLKISAARANTRASDTLATRTSARPIATRRGSPQFEKVQELMPALINEMRTDVMNDKSQLVREFVVLRNSNVIFNQAKAQFRYYETQHEDLQNKVDGLVRYGLVTIVKHGDIPIYCMTERFIDLPKSES